MAPKKQEKEGFYVRGADGNVFGPVDKATLVEWAGDSRIEPTTSISRDQEVWIAAPLMPELEMEWLVETAPGTFYGPFRRSVVEGLMEAGTIARDVRLYVLEGGKFSADRKRLQADLDAKASAISDLEARFTAQAETTKKTMAFLESKVADITRSKEESDKTVLAERAAERDEVFRTRERADAAEARAVKAEAERDAIAKKLSVMETELADLKAQLDAVTNLSAAGAEKSEVIQPEVVVSEPPPPRNAAKFPGVGSSSGLAALEAAARRELASAKKHGISIGGIFGGKK